MDIKNKLIDSDKNKCRVCSKEYYINDIIINRNLFCHECYEKISTVNINDLQYDFYKIRIKSWLISKYNL